MLVGLFWPAVACVQPGELREGLRGEVINSLNRVFLTPESPLCISFAPNLRTFDTEVEVERL